MASYFYNFSVVRCQSEMKENISNTGSLSVSTIGWNLFNGAFLFSSIIFSMIYGYASFISRICSSRYFILPFFSSVKHFSIDIIIQGINFPVSLFYCTKISLLITLPNMKRQWKSSQENISWKRMCMKTECSFRKAFALMCK